ncbi:hypothetical protein [Aliarcobacter butzleri]|jgi:hypothetical protein|uniref:Uncharacterized protein n=5 Tax=Aliarcobacter butzleri TaxID=28197 RepID=A0AAP4Q036_9BACT|nr:hypothetical protein [Aliarcobacter butzleri]EFU70639.1 conserved hypothetical protein [Aliarcobacter butzleri JV22]KLD98958.1 hypothetical protein AF74_01510 [Aliarcobacter butzleri L349]KLE00345.1 hypothetical protein AA20_05835 [Aliarcobacter butzleri L348]KLE03766.1 hypothetical protein AF77_08540 [Aliarcobacter butzleri L352]KLE06619.1 hypothetical protein AF78_02445 [Aliarcobacter butzleri L353]
MSYEVRKLPKKTVIIISLIVSIAIVIFLVQKTLKEQRFAEILGTLGHTNITELKIINKLNVEDVQTKLKSNVFKVKFFDKDLNQTCIGFLHKEKDDLYSKDFDCK